MNLDYTAHLLNSMKNYVAFLYYSKTQMGIIGMNCLGVYTKHTGNTLIDVEWAPWMSYFETSIM